MRTRVYLIPRVMGLIGSIELIPGLVHRKQLLPALSWSTYILLVGLGSGFDFTQLSPHVMLH